MELLEILLTLAALAVVGWFLNSSERLYREMGPLAFWANMAGIAWLLGWPYYGITRELGAAPVAVWWVVGILGGQVLVHRLERRFKAQRQRSESSE